MRAVAEISHFSSAGIVPCQSVAVSDLDSPFKLTYEQYHEFLFRVKRITVRTIFNDLFFTYEFDGYKHPQLTAEPELVDERTLHLWPGFSAIDTNIYSGYTTQVCIGFVDSTIGADLQLVDGGEPVHGQHNQYLSSGEMVNSPNFPHPFWPPRMPNDFGPVYVGDTVVGGPVVPPPAAALLDLNKNKLFPFVFVSVNAGGVWWNAGGWSNILRTIRQPSTSTSWYQYVQMGWLTLFDWGRIPLYYLQAGPTAPTTRLEEIIVTASLYHEYANADGSDPVWHEATGKQLRPIPTNTTPIT